MNISRPTIVASQSQALHLRQKVSQVLAQAAISEGRLDRLTLADGQSVEDLKMQRQPKIGLLARASFRDREGNYELTVRRYRAQGMKAALGAGLTVLGMNGLFLAQEIGLESWAKPYCESLLAKGKSLAPPIDHFQYMFTPHNGYHQVHQFSQVAVV